MVASSSLFKAFVLLLTGIFKAADGQCTGFPQNITGGNGFLFSPEYPDEYPKKTSCRWEFHVPLQDDHMIILRVLDIKLYYYILFVKYCTGSLVIDEETISCKRDDSFCYAYFNSETCNSMKENHCTRKPLPSLRLPVTFTSNNDNGHLLSRAKGFKMQYEYYKCPPVASASKTSTAAASTSEMLTTGAKSTTKTTNQSYTTSFIEPEQQTTSENILQTRANNLNQTSYTGRMTMQDYTSAIQETSEPTDMNVVIGVVAVIIVLLIMLSVILAMLIVKKRGQIKQAAPSNISENVYCNVAHETGQSDTYEMARNVNEGYQLEDPQYTAPGASNGNAHPTYELAKEMGRRNQPEAQLYSVVIKSPKPRDTPGSAHNGLATEGPVLVDNVLYGATTSEQSNISEQFIGNLRDEQTIQTPEMVDNVLYGMTIGQSGEAAEN